VQSAFVNYLDLHSGQKLFSLVYRSNVFSEEVLLSKIMCHKIGYVMAWLN